ncbi:MAG: hypothetical protein LBC77_08835 [Spirochaetaceae bacterium]|jgi:hypothetical protein|nr:hypothetical protein [Spirochaetaceae bacterium]
MKLRIKTALFFVIVFAAPPSAPLHARTEAQIEAQTEAEVPLESLENVLKSAEFGAEKTGFDIRLKDKSTGKPRLPQFENLAEFINTAASYALRFAAVLVCALLLALILVKLKKLPLKNILRKNARAVILPQSNEPSAAFLLELALSAHNAGRTREAWLNIFRAVVRALNKAGCVLPSGATEYECAERAGAFLRARSGEAAFGIIVEQRVRTAYRGEAGIEERFAESAEFCKALIEGGGVKNE